MTDLYQQAPGSKGYGPQDWEVVRRMAPGAMLLWVVPVEPDYEAAVEPMRDVIMDHEDGEFVGHGAVKYIVDAALGIVDEMQGRPQP